MFRYDSKLTIKEIRYYMNEELFNQLERDNPDLFQKSKLDYISVGDGWYSIISNLFNTISDDVQHIRGQIHYAEQKPIKDEDHYEYIDDLRSQLNLEIKRLPHITEIKEKYGRLRVGYSSYDTKYCKAIEFAEKLSNDICEECGSPGKVRDTGWLKVLCDHHYDKFYGKIIVDGRNNIPP